MQSSLVLGALLAAGSIADDSDDWWPGLIVGPAAAALGFARRALALRPRARAPGRRTPPARCRSTPRASALLAAGLSVLFPPLAVLFVAALAWLLLGGRRRPGEKYAGLRILR